MGTQTHRSTQSNQPTTNVGGMPTAVSRLPASIAPSALAKNLDDGWEEEIPAITARPSPRTNALAAPSSMPPALNEDGSDWDVAAAQAQPVATLLQRDTHATAQAIDITIPPTFPPAGIEHAGIETFALAPLAPPGAAKSLPPATSLHSVTDRKASPTSRDEPLSSMSPVTASNQAAPDRPKRWLLAVAAAAVIGLVWGGFGVRHPFKSDARKSLSNAVTVVAAQKHQQPAAAPQQVFSTPEPAAVVAVADPSAPAVPADHDVPGSVEHDGRQSVESKRADGAEGVSGKNRAAPRRWAAPAVSPSQRKPLKASQPDEPAPSVGDSSANLNAPIAPTGGSLAPKAFSSTDSAAPAIKVRVEVDPPDSRIAVRGRATTAPYVFEVPKGGRLVLEVAHTGYITRRILLDGSRDFVHIGMIPEPNPTEPADDAPAQPAAPAPEPPPANATEPRSGS